MASTHDVVIIGAGIVGLATALELTRRHPELSVVVLEKESRVAAHQTGHNSGVIHSGIYYKSGSEKARMCVAGAAEMIAFCREHGLPIDICGKVVVATEEHELPALNELHARGQANGVPGVRLIGPEEIRELEPHAIGIRGLHVPGTGITDYALVAAKYAELIQASGAELKTNARVTGIARDSGVSVIETTAGTFRARNVINCAGLHSDAISRMAGAQLNLRIIPFRGEYYDLIPAKHHLVRGLIYPVPDPRFPFLGVHFTRRVNGGVEAGPNAVLAFKREGYSKTSFSLSDTLATASFPGFWKMAAKLWGNAAGEYYRSFSKTAFVHALQRLLPGLTAADVHAGGSGVRAQALDINGKLLDDFRFAYTEGIIHVCNVPSPAATASLVIGREIASMLEARSGLRSGSPTASNPAQ